MKLRMPSFFILTLLALMLFAFSAFGQVDNMSARAIGMGGAYTAFANDYNSTVWNPAAMESFRETALGFTTSMLYLGVTDDNLMRGNLGFVSHLGKGGRAGAWGLSYTHHMSDIYTQGSFTLGYAKRLYGKADGAHLALGANMKLYYNAFNTGMYQKALILPIR